MSIKMVSDVTEETKRMPMSTTKSTKHLAEEYSSPSIDLLIDDCGQELQPLKYSRQIWRSLNSANAFRDLMADFRMSGSLLPNFVSSRLNINCRDLAGLNDRDWKNLGIQSRSARKQMLKEFAAILKSTKESPDDINPTLDLVHLFQYVTNLKFSLCPMLVRLYDHPETDVVINDRSYRSQLVLQTIHDIDSIANRLELLLSHLQLNQHKHTNKKPNYRHCFWWILLAAGVTSVCGVVFIRNSMQRAWRYSERLLVGHLVPSYPRW